MSQNNPTQIFADDVQEEKGENARLSAFVGAIAVGRYGDLIAVTGDPLADVTRLQTVSFVRKGGEVILRR